VRRALIAGGHPGGSRTRTRQPNGHVLPGYQAAGSSTDWLTRAVGGHRRPMPAVTYDLALSCARLYRMSASA